MTQLDLDGRRFVVHRHDRRGFAQAFVREGTGGVPLLCVHGWPETKRIWWRVIEPLRDAGMEVIVPDLRGFGDSGFAPDGLYDVASHSRDLHSLVTDGLGHSRVVLCGGDLGGAIIQDFALRFPDAVERMVLFNCPLPRATHEIGSLAPRETSDYFVRQGTEADQVAAELNSEAQRQRYVAAFYTSRFWAHPGAFLDPAQRGRRYHGSAVVDFHTEPFADAARLRASFGVYEGVYATTARREPACMAVNDAVETMILYGPSDHVIEPNFDLRAASTFRNHVGPFRLRDCGHFVPWEAPDQLASAVRVFCRDLIAARRSPP
jgi:pimeloyl-ACP methyl ester carboxylesterase